MPEGRDPYSSLVNMFGKKVQNAMGRRLFLAAMCLVIGVFTLGYALICLQFAWQA